MLAGKDAARLAGWIIHASGQSQLHQAAVPSRTRGAAEQDILPTTRMSSAVEGGRWAILSTIILMQQIFSSPGLLVIQNGGIVVEHRSLGRLRQNYHSNLR